MSPLAALTAGGNPDWLRYSRTAWVPCHSGSKRRRSGCRRNELGEKDGGLLDAVRSAKAHLDVTANF